MSDWRCLLGALIISIGFASGKTNGQITERTLRWAQQNSMDHPQGMGAQRFSELVEQRSAGKIKVRVFPSGQLGGDLQNVEALQSGALDLMVLNAGLLVGIVKDFAVLDLPFLFNTPEEADAVVDGPVGKKLLDKLPAKNLVGLGYFELGFRNVTNNKHPITKVENFKGIKLRVLQSPLFIEFFTMLGSNTFAIPFSEVYPAIQQNIIDGQENPFTVIYDSNFQDVQKYVSLTQHIYNVQSVLVSKRTWDRLSSEEQKIIRDSLDEAKIYQRQVSRKKASEAAEALKEAGMQINQISPGEMDRIKVKAQPVIEKYAVEVGRDLYDQVVSEITKRRGMRLP